MYYANSRSAMNAYRSIGVESIIDSASPQRLVQLLFDGARAAVASAALHLQRGEVPAKCEAIAKAIAIVDGGLKASLDLNVGGKMAQNLSDLYVYMTQRLLEANLKNDAKALDEVARSPKSLLPRAPSQRSAVAATDEPALLTAPPAAFGFVAPEISTSSNTNAVAGKDVWLVHAWSLGQRPPEVPKDAICIAIAVAEFHQQNPWSALRWNFVGQRMADMASARWFGSAQAICAALAGARCVHVVEDLHLGTFQHHLLALAHRSHPQPLLFESVDRLCASFSGWWKQTRIAAHHHDS